MASSHHVVNDSIIDGAEVSAAAAPGASGLRLSLGLEQICASQVLELLVSLHGRLRLGV